MATHSTQKQKRNKHCVWPLMAMWFVFVWPHLFGKIDYLTVTKGPHLHMVPLIRARLRANEFTLGGSCAVFSDLPVCCRSVNTRSVSPCSCLTSPRYGDGDRIDVILEVKSELGRSFEIRTDLVLRSPG